MGGNDLNTNSTEFVIGQLTASLTSTTDALNKVTERLQMVTMTVETLNSKLNSLSDLYQHKIESLEKQMQELEKRQNRDYARLNALDDKIKSFGTIDEVEELVKEHSTGCQNNKPSTGSEQRVFFIVLSVMSVISTIVALVK